MGMGQTLITIGAIMLLSLVILRVNNNFLSTNTVLLTSKFGVLGVSLATSVIEEANGKSFDHNTDTTTVTATNQLSSCGPESGEVYPNFNDFDDFDGLSVVDSTMPTANFKIDCVVDYVNNTNPDVPVASKTWHKRIFVTITSPSMPEDTVTMSSIFSYWYFR